MCQENRDQRFSSVFQNNLFRETVIMFRIREPLGESRSQRFNVLNQWLIELSTGDDSNWTIATCESSPAAANLQANSIWVFKAN